MATWQRRSSRTAPVARSRDLRGRQRGREDKAATGSGVPLLAQNGSGSAVTVTLAAPETVNGLPIRSREIAVPACDLGLIPPVAGAGVQDPVDPRVMAALQRLPARQRQVITLRLILDLDTSDPAKALGIRRRGTQGASPASWTSSPLPAEADGSGRQCSRMRRPLALPPARAGAQTTLMRAADPLLRPAKQRRIALMQLVTSGNTQRCADSLAVIGRPGCMEGQCYLPRRSGDERGDDVSSVPVQAGPCPVIAHGGARVGVGGGLLHVAQRRPSGVLVLETKGIDPLVQMGTLEALLTGEHYDVIVSRPRAGQQVAAKNSQEGPWVVTLTDELQAALAAAPRDQIAAVAAPWWETEEFRGQGDPESLAEFLVELANLARQANQRGERLYCWMCLLLGLSHRPAPQSGTRVN